MSISDNLNQQFGIVVDSPPEVHLPTVVNEEPISVHKSTDVNLVRDTLVDMLQRSTDLLDESIVLAKESQSPRAYETTAGLMETIAKLSKELMELHTKQAPAKTDEGPTQNNTQNNFYVGTTADLQKLVSEMKK